MRGCRQSRFPTCGGANLAGRAQRRDELALVDDGRRKLGRPRGLLEKRDPTWRLLGRWRQLRADRVHFTVDRDFVLRGAVLETQRQRAWPRDRGQDLGTKNARARRARSEEHTSE